jgi:hypothetical protein
MRWEICEFGHSMCALHDSSAMRIPREQRNHMTTAGLVMVCCRPSRSIVECACFPMEEAKSLTMTGNRGGAPRVLWIVDSLAGLQPSLPAG